MIAFTWLRAMQSRNCGSVLGRGKRLPSSLICPRRLRGTPSLLCNGHLATSPETERSRREFDHLFPSSSEVRMCGAQFLLPYTHSYSSEERLYEVTANHTVTRIYLSSAYYQNRFGFNIIICIKFILISTLWSWLWEMRAVIVHEIPELSQL